MRYLVFLFLLSTLQAHNLKIFTSKDKDFIHVKAYFSAKSPCMDCNITAIRYDKKPSFTSKTDKKGNAKISLDINPIEIIVNADLGHRNSVKLKPTLQKQNTDLPMPFWVKILMAFICIFSFFAGLKWAKKK